MLVSVSHDWSQDQFGQSESQRERERPPRILIISISHQLQRSAGGGNDDAGGTSERPHLMGWGG